METAKSQQLQKFCTKSSYTGERDECDRMHGYGIYKYPNGIEYHGQFDKGEFHGDGSLLFPTKYKIRAHWDHGKIAGYEVIFPDDLVFIEENWSYCTKMDRRYAECLRNGIPPVGDGFITKEKPPRKIPAGCYDTEEGFYNPRTGLLMDVTNPNLPVRVPSADEEFWILDNCRRADDENVGYYGALDIIKDMKRIEKNDDEDSDSYQYTEQSEYLSYSELE